MNQLIYDVSPYTYIQNEEPLPLRKFLTNITINVTISLFSVTVSFRLTLKQQ